MFLNLESWISIGEVESMLLDLETQRPPHSDPCQLSSFLDLFHFVISWSRPFSHNCSLSWGSILVVHESRN